MNLYTVGWNRDAWWPPLIIDQSQRPSYGRWYVQLIVGPLRAGVYCGPRTPINQLFTCTVCGGEFEKGWTERDADAERLALWPGFTQEECGRACVPCFRKVMAWAGSYDPYGALYGAILRPKGKP